ncbi:hypothetical protein ACHAWX_004991 [Stephanocyclus meneghinianus]
MSSQQQNDEDNQPATADDQEASFLIDVSSSLPSLSSIHSFLTYPSCGAISLFSGTTRNNFNGKIVTSLSYEGYIPMAIKELTKLCREAKETFGVEKIVAVHLVGECPVGEVSVIVGSCGAHRRETIRCTEFLIDELKARYVRRSLLFSQSVRFTLHAYIQKIGVLPPLVFYRPIFKRNNGFLIWNCLRVPIWKKEIYEGDESIWKENVEWLEGRRRRVMRREEKSVS